MAKGRMCYSAFAVAAGSFMMLGFISSASSVSSSAGARNQGSVNGNQEGSIACENTLEFDDWLARIPAQQRWIFPNHCRALQVGSLFSWGEPVDRDQSMPWRLAVRSKSGATVTTLTDLREPRAILKSALPQGEYEWSVAYSDRAGREQRSQWRRFSVVGGMSDPLRGSRSTPSPGTQDLPDGAAVAAQVAAKGRPRVLPVGSSFAGIAAAAQTADFKPVLLALRQQASAARLRRLDPPSAALGQMAAVDRVARMRDHRHAASAARESISLMALIGQLDNDATLLSAARERLVALAAWPVDGETSEKNNNLANREVYLGLAIGLDLLWHGLSESQRALIAVSLRHRVLQAVAELEYLNRVPYEAHRVSNTRWVTQALMLVAGRPEFPEAQGLLEKYWNLSRFTLGVWGDGDGSFGNGIAYGWYSFIQVVPYVAAVRVITGIDLYQLPFLRHAGEQLMAFTAPDHAQTSAFGDETETVNLYRNNASNFYRLHAQMTRDPVDAWYWQVRASNVDRPALQQIWQLLLLGVDATPLPQPQRVARHSWFFQDAGLAALHVDAAASKRTSLFFRSSQFGAFNHSHADQNSFVLVVRGQPLLIGAGYYPYYGSPHHRLVTRATRYKNALTFDGGIGQAEDRSNPDQPGEPMQSMDASGSLIRAETLGSLSLVTGDATVAYRGYDRATGRWLPLLRAAYRSVIMDRARGVVFIYDWAESERPRRWELNLHTGKGFRLEGDTVKVEDSGASVCIDRYGPSSTFEQTMAWDVPPELSLPPQAHGRFAVEKPTSEFASLMVLRIDCREIPASVEWVGGAAKVVYKGIDLNFSKRRVGLGN